MIIQNFFKLNFQVSTDNNQPKASLVWGPEGTSPLRLWKVIIWKWNKKQKFVFLGHILGFGLSLTFWAYQAPAINQYSQNLYHSFQSSAKKVINQVTKCLVFQWYFDTFQKD